MIKKLKETFQNSPLLYDKYLEIRIYIESFLPRKYLISKEWKQVFGEELNLENPKTYNEKLQWGKVYANNKLAKQCADKVGVLEYVRSKIGSSYINELIAIYPNTKTIDFSKLPEQFVLKATHDSGSVLIVKDKNQLDYKKLNKIENSLKINYGAVTQEWVYDDIKPQIIIEKFLESDDGATLKDYKIFCFAGKAKIIEIDLDRFEGHKQSYYDTAWNRLNFEFGFPILDYDVKKPELIEEMLRLSSILSEPFNHVRIDWYICKNRLVFGEMTFFTAGGFGKFSSKEWEEKMGAWIELSKDLSYRKE